MYNYNMAESNAAAVASLSSSTILLPKCTGFLTSNPNTLVWKMGTQKTAATAKQKFDVNVIVALWYLSECKTVCLYVCMLVRRVTSIERVFIISVRRWY